MRSNLSVKLGLLTIVVVTSALVASPASQDGDGRSAMTFLERWQQSEVARIQEHLAGAERLLLEADVSALSPAQRAARARNVALLRGYRERGVFPRNIDFADRREPYFVDDRGVLCAMAYLIAASGRNDIVERVRSSRNNARIRELTDDAALVTWLEESGLTAAEAGRIQPAYGPIPTPFPVYEVERDRVSPEYAVASGGASLLNGMAIAWNWPRAGANAPSTRAGAFAVLTGAAGVALGAPFIGDGGAATALGTWNLAVGALAFLSGANTLLSETRSRRSAVSSLQSRRPAKAGSRPGHGAAVNIAPTAGSGAGVLLNVTF